jgi:hypothetical protein
MQRDSVRHQLHGLYPEPRFAGWCWSKRLGRKFKAFDGLRESSLWDFSQKSRGIIFRSIQVSAVCGGLCGT